MFVLDLIKQGELEVVETEGGKVVVEEQIEGGAVLQIYDSFAIVTLQCSLSLSQELVDKAES